MIVMAALLSVFGGYMVSSLVLLRFPTVIHTRKKLKFCARHISHRGGAAENLENTIAAFEHAHSLGTQMFELDCQLTKDGQVVVSHDDSLRRSCGLDMRISDTDYGDLPRLSARLNVDFLPGVLAEGEDRKIPLLETVFQQFPQMPINIDIKTNNNELIQKVHDLVKKYGREEITAWGNRSDDVCKKLYKMNPTVPMYFSLRRVVYLMIFFWTGLLPFVPLKESFLEVLLPSILSDPESILAGNLTSFQKFIFKAFDFLLMRPALIKHLERRGIQTYLWVLNSEKDFQRAFQLGAAGVMTDRVTLLRKYLDDNQQSWNTDSNNSVNSYQATEGYGGTDSKKDL